MPHCRLQMQRLTQQPKLRQKSEQKQSLMARTKPLLRQCLLTQQTSCSKPPRRRKSQPWRKTQQLHHQRSMQHSQRPRWKLLPCPLCQRRQLLPNPSTCRRQ